MLNFIVNLRTSRCMPFTYFTHANLKLPDKLDKFIGLIFVSPNMHKVHHQYLPYTDSNFGNVLSVWDRLFGTLKMLKSHEVSFGLDTDLKEKELAFVYQIKRLLLKKKQR